MNPISETSINISSASTYEINYYINLSASVATTVTMAVRVNGTNIPSTIITRGLSVGVSSIYSRSTIVTLTPGDVIISIINSWINIRKWSKRIIKRKKIKLKENRTHIYEFDF